MRWLKRVALGVLILGVLLAAMWVIPRLAVCMAFCWVGF